MQGLRLFPVRQKEKKSSVGDLLFLKKLRNGEAMSIAAVV
jgi:hypothetical protein